MSFHIFSRSIDVHCCINFVTPTELFNEDLAEVLPPPWGGDALMSFSITATRELTSVSPIYPANLPSPLTQVRALRHIQDPYRKTEAKQAHIKRSP